MKHVIAILFCLAVVCGCKQQYPDGSVVNAGDKVKHTISGREGLVLKAEREGTYLEVQCPQTSQEKREAPRAEFTIFKWKGSEVHEIDEFTDVYGIKEESDSPATPEDPEQLKEAKAEIAKLNNKHTEIEVAYRKYVTAVEGQERELKLEISRLKFDVASAKHTSMMSASEAGEVKAKLAVIRQEEEEAKNGLVQIRSRKAPMFRREVKRAWE